MSRLSADPGSRTSTAPLRRSTPPFANSASGYSVVCWPTHEHHSVEVDWLPFVAVSLERESLLTTRCVNHQCLAVLHVLDNLDPQQIADTSRDVSDVYAGTDLQ